MRHIPVMATAALAAILLWGCGQKSSDTQATSEKSATAAIPAAAPQAKTASVPKAATIAQLLLTPKAYAGKDVTVKGVFSGICCASDFFLKDGVDTIEVYATRMCPIPSKSKIRSKLTVIGTVAVRNDHPALTAKELRFE